MNNRFPTAHRARFAREADRFLHLVLTQHAPYLAGAEADADRKAQELGLPILLRATWRGIALTPRTLAHQDRTWNTQVNRALLEGGRLDWDPDAFDTFQDHLLDVLAERGLVASWSKHALVRELPGGFVEPIHAGRAALAEEALERAIATYDSHPIHLSA